MLRIADWVRHYEPETDKFGRLNSRSAKWPLPWFKRKTRLGVRARQLINLDPSAGFYGVWSILQGLAADQHITDRGVLPAGIDPDYPDDLDGICESIRLLTGISMEALQKAIAVLISPIGWLEEFSSKEPSLGVVTPPVIPEPGQRHAPYPQKRRPLQKRFAPAILEDIESRFDAFWEVYPRKVGKDATCREWISFD